MILKVYYLINSLLKFITELNLVFITTKVNLRTCRRDLILLNHHHPLKYSNV